MPRKWKSDEIDWVRIFDAMTHPKRDENGEEYIDATPEEIKAVDEFCTFLLQWKFRERPELPIEMQRKQDDAFNELVKKSFAYLEPKP